MLDHALELAEAGWRVFPCIPNGPKAKAPYTTNGFHDATYDPEIIRAWWERWPDAMIGAPVPDELVVIDIDPRNGGSLDAIEAVAGKLPETLTSWSGREDGGRHMYFWRPQGVNLTSTRLPAGVDLKVGGRGYCILPPSIHQATGKPYRWGEPLCHILDLPYRLRDLLCPPPRVSRVPVARHGNVNPSGLLRVVRDARQGQRNNALFWSAARAAENGILETLTAELVSISIANGLTDSEALDTIASAARTAKAQR